MTVAVAGGNCTSVASDDDSDEWISETSQMCAHKLLH